MLRTSRSLVLLASKPPRHSRRLRRGLASAIATSRHSEAPAETTAFAVPTSVDTAFSIPLTLVDVHLKDEQLPFAYFFHETLDPSKLESSLARVLRHFPVLGGTVNLDRGVIDCNPCDSVSLTFSESELSMQEWLLEAPAQRLTPGRPAQVLSPLFDCLHHESSSKSDSGNNLSSSLSLASIRVTHFSGGGTALGVNLSHSLADAASCFRFVQCWGREMQGLAYPSASNKRANATCSGMLSPEILDMLDMNGKQKRVHQQQQQQQQQEQHPWSLAALLLPLGSELHDDGGGSGKGDHTASQDPCAKSDHGAHEYVSLPFSPQVLKAMKAHGMAQCHGTETKYVSTNDVLTAFGWLMKRRLSGRAESNMSMVVNLRGRSDVDDFCEIEDKEGSQGVFGNGIASIMATLPAANDKVVKLEDLSDAAIAVRLALTEGLLDIPDRLLLSRFGRAASTPTQSSGCFAVTSWQHFPLYDISFSKQGGGLAAFSGHPSHPLPEGSDTYNSIIVPEKCGSQTYQLLAPSNKVEEAKSFHKEMCALYLAWYDNHTSKEQQNICK